MATLLAFLATLATDLRMHVLERRAAKDLERQAVERSRGRAVERSSGERHDALLAALSVQNHTPARVTRASARPGVLVAVGVLAGMLLTRHRR